MRIFSKKHYFFFTSSIFSAFEFFSFEWTKSQQRKTFVMCFLKHNCFFFCIAFLFFFIFLLMVSLNFQFLNVQFYCIQIENGGCGQCEDYFEFCQIFGEFYINVININKLK